MGYSGIQGIPMIASSPVRHDSPLNLHGLEVTSYQPPWKALSDFALHADLDNNGALNHTPAFQHLVNQASHHHFSYLYSFFLSFVPCLSTTCLNFYSIFSRFLSLVSTQNLFILSLFPQHSLYYLFACFFGFFCLSFFLSRIFILLIFFTSSFLNRLNYFRK